MPEPDVMIDTIRTIDDIFIRMAEAVHGLRGGRPAIFSMFALNV